MTAVATTVAVSRGRPEVPLQVITPADVRASVRRAKKSLEAAAAEIVWQIEREAWRTLGYSSWTAMREAEYGGAAFMVPSKSRPEIVARIKEIEVGRTARGNPKRLTDREIAATAGISEAQVRTDTGRRDKFGSSTSFVDSDDDVIDAEIVEDDEPINVNTETGEIDPDPVKPRRRPINELLREAGAELDRAVERINRLAQDDRYAANTDLINPYIRNAIHQLETIAQEN